MNKFRVASVFSNNCVLQRNEIITIFGYLTQSAKIKVSLFNSKNKLLCENERSFFIEEADASQNSSSSQSQNDEKLKWQVQLEKQTAQENCVLKVLCTFSSGEVSETIFSDVAIGEVWICGGQSNMEFELQNCSEGPDVLKSNTDGKNIRFYYTKKMGWMDEKFFKEEKNSCWEKWESEGRKAWSAVGYFFAKQLEKPLDCTIGLIGCNWGGTSASCWMAKENLEKNEDLRTYLDEYEKATNGKSIEEQCLEYENYEKEAAKWNEGFSKLWEKDHNVTWETAEKVLGKNPWPGPASCKNPYRPTGLYECMLSRIMPYTVKGVIWYQGESDDHKPKMYDTLFSTMIGSWRKGFQNEELPFIFVQLPNHRYLMDKDFKHWCLVREAQNKVHNAIKNAYMCVALDKGQFNDIHPKQKKVVGQRLANIALEKIYEKQLKNEVFSPMYKNHIIKKDKIIVYFSHADDGFLLVDDKTTFEQYCELEKIQNNEVKDFTGFEIAGKDKVFYAAKAEFGKGEQSNSITLYSDFVKEPVYARYGWFNYAPVTVYGKSKLPLAPFRTSDDNNDSTNHAKIQQIMTVAN